MHIILHVMQENQINFEIFVKLQFHKPRVNQRYCISLFLAVSLSLCKESLFSHISDLEAPVTEG